MANKTITITIPEVLHQALSNEGKELGQEPGDVIKTGLHIAYKASEGWTLKLKPVGLPPDPNQLELIPAGGA